jgi:AsmA family protein
MENALMRIAKILMVVLAVVVVLLIGAAIVLMSMDFNQYKPQIVAEVKKATGREMTIGGDLHLNLFTLNPGLTVDKVTFANAPWGSRPEMATIKRFEVKVSILPLLHGALDVDQVVLDGADILIERNREGVGNYEFDTGTKAPATAKPAEAPKAGSGGGDLPALAVHEVTIKDARLTYKDAKSGQTLILGIKALAVDGAPGEPLKLKLDGTYNGEPFAVKGSMGELAELLRPTKPWPLTVTAEAGGAKVDVKGSIANPQAATGIDIALSVEGDDLSKLSGFTGSVIPPLGPYALDAKIAGSIDKAIDVSAFSAKMGRSMLTGKASVQLKGKPALTATLASDLIYLDDFTKGGEGAGKPAAGTAAGGGAGGGKSGGKDGKRLFPDDPLPLDGLKAADANVDLTVKKLVADKLAVDNIHTVVVLKNGDLTVSPLDAEVATGKVAGAVTLKGSQATPALDVKVSGKKIDVGKLLADMGISDLLYGIINTDVDVKGQGKSVHQIMAGLDGKTSVVMGEGKMKSEALDVYVGGAATVLTQLIAGKKSQYTVINCFMNQFDVKQGIATSKVMLFDTEYAQITGAGTINLGTEQINYTLDPKPKSVTVNTAVPVEIKGPLTGPSIGLNPLAAAAKIGGLIGTFVFPPAAVLTLGELGASDNNPCVKQASGKQPSTTESKGSGPAGVVEGLEKKLDTDVKKKLDEGIKKLFGK